MTPTEIITKDAEAHRIDPKKVLAVIAQQIKTNASILLHKNDSVLVIRTIAPSAVDLHLFTQDTPVALARSIAYFAQKIKKSDIQVMYGQADNPEILRFVQAFGFRVQQSDRPQYNWMAMVKG